MKLSVDKNTPLRDLSVEPWNICFYDRLKRVVQANGKKVAIHIHDAPHYATFRYRVFNIAQAMDYSEEWVVSYFYENELNLLESILSHIHLVVFVRVRWSYEIDNFLQQIIKRNIPKAFDIDDLLFDLTKVQTFLENLGKDPSIDANDYYTWFNYFSRYWLMANLCDFTIGTNQYLCDRLKEVFNKPCFEINNFLNDEQILISENLYQEKQKNSQFTLGYFSGTPSHKNDFKKIADELAGFLQDHSDAHLEVVGYMELPTTLKKFDKTRVYQSPLVNFLDLQKKKSLVHVNLIPLMDNEFTNCKSELKFFEAAIVGTISCATPTYVYKTNIEDSKNGILCQQSDWYNAFKKIYQQNYPKDLQDSARNYCLEKYSPKNQSKQIEKVFNSLINDY